MVDVCYLVIINSKVTFRLQLIMQSLIIFNPENRGIWA